MQIILYIENLKDFTKRLLKTNKHNKIARYKVNTQKSVVFLYTNYKKYEKEIKKTIPKKSWGCDAQHGDYSQEFVKPFGVILGPQRALVPQSFMSQCRKNSARGK